MAANAVALTWGLGLFMMTWWLIFFEGASQEPVFLSKFYMGYRVSPLGSIIGMLWAMLDGWIGGAVLAWIYNSFARSQRAA